MAVQIHPSPVDNGVKGRRLRAFSRRQRLNVQVHDRSGQGDDKEQRPFFQPRPCRLARSAGGNRRAR